jgi:hypothetical protein
MSRYNNCEKSQHLTLFNRTSRKNINKDILEQNNTTDEADITNIYRVFYPMKQITHFSQQPMKLFSKIDHTIGQKENLNNYKKS